MKTTLTKDTGHSDLYLLSCLLSVAVFAQTAPCTNTPDFTGETSTVAVGIGETADIIGVAKSTQFFAAPAVNIIPTALPDGTGVAYDVPADATGYFPPSAEVTSMCLPTVCVNLEHSWAGDITIDIIAPSGELVRLFDQERGGADLGTCANAEDDGVPGCSAEYCFSSTSTDPIAAAPFVPASNCPGYAGACESDDNVAAGTYSSASPMSGLIGASLNGVWIIRLTDNAAADDGTIDGANLIFPTACYGDPIGDNPEIVASSWTAGAGPPLGTAVNTDLPYTSTDVECASVTPADGCLGNTWTDTFSGVGPFPTGGSYEYFVTYTDVNSCTFDRTITVNVTAMCSTIGDPCDDNDTCTENDVFADDGSGTGTCSCAGTPIDFSTVDFMPMEGDCVAPPQITLPPGYTCAYAYAVATGAAHPDGTGAVAMYSGAGAVTGDMGAVTFTITRTGCGTVLPPVVVNYNCYMCLPENGTWVD